MKHGKNPTVRQAIFIQKNICLNPGDWLVAKDTPTEMLLVHRTDRNKTIKLSKVLRMVGERRDEDGEICEIYL